MKGDVYLSEKRTLSLGRKLFTRRPHGSRTSLGDQSGITAAHWLASLIIASIAAPPHPPPLPQVWGRVTATPSPSLETGQGVRKTLFPRLSTGSHNIPRMIQWSLRWAGIDLLHDGYSVTNNSFRGLLIIGISKLYCRAVEASDPLRYGRHSKSLPSHLLQFSSDKKPVVVWNVTRCCNLKCVRSLLSVGTSELSG